MPWGPEFEAAPQIRAAAVVARAHGLEVTEPVRLRESSNVLVHLRPSPVVARVMTATASLHDDPGAWLTREVAVGLHLRAGGAPATAPTTLVPPGPHVEDGLWITFWELVAETPRSGLPDPAELGTSLRALHEALASYAGPPLRGVAAIGAEVGALLGGLRPGPWLDARSIAAARDAHRRVVPILERASGSTPIHGDASISNVLSTPAGPLWNDFEDVCIGPVEWDLAGLVLDLLDHGATDAEATAFLAGYGDHRTDLMPPLSELHRLYGIAWHASRAEQHPRSRERLARHLAAADAVQVRGARRAW